LVRDKSPSLYNRRRVRAWAHLGLIFGLLGCLTGNFNVVIVRLAATLLGGLSGALQVGSLKPVMLVEAMSWKWDQMPRPANSTAHFLRKLSQLQD
jgi:hypothetical protein